MDPRDLIETWKTRSPEGGDDGEVTEVPCRPEDSGGSADRDDELGIDRDLGRGRGSEAADSTRAVTQLHGKDKFKQKP